MLSPHEATAVLINILSSDACVIYDYVCELKDNIKDIFQLDYDPGGYRGRKQWMEGLCDSSQVNDELYAGVIEGFRAEDNAELCKCNAVDQAIRRLTCE